MLIVVIVYWKWNKNLKKKLLNTNLLLLNENIFWYHEYLLLQHFRNHSRLQENTHNNWYISPKKNPSCLTKRQWWVFISNDDFWLIGPSFLKSLSFNEWPRTEILQNVYWRKVFWKVHNLVAASKYVSKLW